MTSAADSRYRVLVIGTGFATRVQIPVLLEHPRFVVRAVSSRTPARGRAVAEEMGIPVHGSDWRGLVGRDDIDAVSVVSEVAEHRDQAVATLGAGKHLLLEKPMAMGLDEAREILDTAPASVGSAINHEFRYQPDVMTLKRLLETGELGRLRGLELRTFFSFWADPAGRTHGWLSRADRGGGILGALGSHHVDMVRFLTGLAVNGVSGEAWTVLPQRCDAAGVPQPVTADDTSRFQLELDGGVRAQIEIHTTTWWNENVIRVFGERSTATLDGNGSVRLNDSSGDERTVDPYAEFAWTSKPDEDIRKPLFHRLLDRFAARCDGRDTPDLATLTDGLETMRVLDAVRSGVFSS